MANKIGNHLWLDSWRGASDRSWLRENNIKTIINVAEDFNDPDQPGIRQIKIGLTDGPGNEPWMIRLAIDTVLLAIDKADGTDENVLVHCIAGRSRSPYIAARALELFHVGNYSFDQIWASIRKERPEVLEKSLIYSDMDVFTSH